MQPEGPASRSLRPWVVPKRPRGRVHTGGAADNAALQLNAAMPLCSLYDALYGTGRDSQDGELGGGKGYNPKRGEKVIAFAREA